jgi:hypothetical protein
MGTALAVTQRQSIEATAQSWASTHSAKRCPRCNGLMVAEWCQDLSDYRAQRCVQCGEVVDPVILQNRRQCGMTIGPGQEREHTPRESCNR